MIDYWAGVPLCFLVSCWAKLRSRLFGERKAEGQPRRILFIELSEMGSAILAYSSLVQAQLKFPGAELYFLIFEKNKESCEILGLLPGARILTIDDRSLIRFTISVFRALWSVHRLAIDTAIDLELFSRCTALLTYLSGAVRRVGFHRSTNEGLYRGALLTHPIPYNPHLHIALNFLALVEALQSSAAQIPMVKRDLRAELLPLPRCIPTTEERADIQRVLQSENPDLTADAELLIFNPDPGEALPIRGWPMDKFIEAARRLLERFPKAVIVVIGLKRSRSYAERMQAVLGKSRCLDLTGKTRNLRAVLTLLDRSKLLLSNDSGPAHIAALAAVPSVVLFGPETPALYGPLSPHARTIFSRFSCSPCLTAFNHRYTKCNDNRCLQAISVDEVANAACSAIEGGSPR